MVAEAIGTFAIVFFGCGAIATLSGVAAPVGVNLVFGAVVGAMILSLGHISCAHFNPAVTIGFAVIRRFPLRLVPAYIGAQLAGASLAAVALSALVPSVTLQPAHFGATIPSITSLGALGNEALVTFFLMLVIVSVATDRRVHGLAAGLAIGATVMISGLTIGSLTGNSMNPARSVGPALLAGGEALGCLWIYLIGPVIGAVVGAITYEFLRGPAAEPREAPITCCDPSAGG